MKNMLKIAAAILAGSILAQTSAGAQHVRADGLQAHEHATISDHPVAFNLVGNVAGGFDDNGELTVAHLDSGAFTGVGGPLEERTGYPPCRPGRGDDECIQLYEAGVTGSGN